MLTYNHKFPRNPEHISQVYTKEVVNEDGSSTILTDTKPFESPYKGLDSDSFKIGARIQAGVPLNRVKPRSLGGSIGSIDNASSMVDKAIVKSSKAE